MPTAPNKLSNKITERFDNTRVTQLLIIILVLGAFYIGNLSAKVSYLEKSLAQGGAGTQVAGVQGGDSLPPAVPTTAPLSQEQFDDLVSKGRNVIGNKDAKVTMVEFSDFQCPYCKNFADNTLPQIKKEYIDTGKVKLIYMHYPLSFHPDAMNSALASECAAEQGKFEEYHDKLFLDQAALGKTNLKEYAVELGLNSSQFDTCLDTEKYKDIINDEMALGTSLGITGTPGFFVDGTLIPGAMPFATFQTTLDAAL